MEYTYCQQVYNWTQRIARAHVFKPFEQPILYRHIASCDECRGALITLSLLEPELLPAYTPIACARASDSLAAFVDAAELTPGSEVELYPDIWWHLLTCEECADEYLALHKFSSTMQQEKRALPAGSRIDTRRKTPALPSTIHVALPRDFLRVALPPLRAQVVYRGEYTEEHRLAQKSLDLGFQAIVSVRQHALEQWLVLVKVDPPLSGLVNLKLGDLEHQGVLDAGSVLIGPVPAELLLDANGPDMVVTIQPDATAE